MNKIEKTIFTIVFVIAALLILIMSICWIMLSIPVGILLTIAYSFWGLYAFSSAWVELDELCKRKHEKLNNKLTPT